MLSESLSHLSFFILTSFQLWLTRLFVKLKSNFEYYLFVLASHVGLAGIVMQEHYTECQEA